jgi:hypothetical protein
MLMEQSFDNHTHRPVAAAVAVAAIVGATACVIMSWRGQNTIGSAVSCLIVVALTYVATSRTYTTALQDRIIRMEMLYRADKLLSPGQRASYATLTLRQVIALRFASDAEFPMLVERTEAEKLEPKEIKRAIKHWQPDLVRT